MINEMAESISDSDDDASSSSSFLNPDTDLESLSLLQEIFPDETLEDLRRLHYQRLQNGNSNEGTRSISMNEAIKMEQKLLHANNLLSSGVFTLVVEKGEGGLGMTLRETRNGKIEVCKLHDPSKWDCQSQDIFIGINGIAFSSVDVVAKRIQESPNPLILHFHRPSHAHQHSHSRSLLDVTSQEDINFLTNTNTSRAIQQPIIHPLTTLLLRKRIIRSTQDQINISKKIQQFTERARQWETTNCMPPSTPYSISHSVVQDNDIFLSLSGIRRALSVRIVNYFVEEESSIVAYTLWVYDVESGKEWYAPIRHFDDFWDLRNATMALSNIVGSFPFPKGKSTWSAYSLTSKARRGDAWRIDSEHAQHKCRQLESFIRNLCSLIYCSPEINTNMTQIALHVESFLGVETGLAETKVDDCIDQPVPPLDSHSWEIRWLLKRSIQSYCFRLFQLDTFQQLSVAFVDATRAQTPNQKEIEILEAQGKGILKARAMKALEAVGYFLDELVDLILEGCSLDLVSIAKHDNFSAIRKSIMGDTTNWNRLVREAIREQVEVEVYVPLRSVVSRLLVNGWKHEDTEVQCKIKELMNRPQSRIPQTRISPESVALILKRGVGKSTFPCAKLRAIVDAAREISRLYTQEHDGKGVVGADEFLPVFIFCVVKANIDRPCALTILLRTLCDRSNSIGEIGYFLASFEAAITHLQEIDLKKDNEETLSYLNFTLREVSLNE